MFEKFERILYIYILLMQWEMDYYFKNKNYIYKGKLYVLIIINFRFKIGMCFVIFDYKLNFK